MIYGNYYDKYGSNNKIESFIVSNYFKKLQILLKDLDYKTILDIGCAEGFVTNEISGIKECDITGIDLSARDISEAKKQYPYLRFIEGDIYKLPFNSKSFDMVIALEVLEHLENPEIALEEIQRVAKKWILFSVPIEPLWRILNILRGKYMKRMGNTPGHLNHWLPGDFTRFIKYYFVVDKYIKSFPWILVLCSS